MDFVASHIFTIIIFVAPLIYSIQPLLLSKINVINNAYDKDLLKRKDFGSSSSANYLLAS